MRDLIVALRPRVALAFDNLPARGIAPGSQSLVLWKDRQYADHRNSYAGNARWLDMSEYTQTDPLLRVPDTQWAQTQMDFEARIDLEEGIPLTAEYYRGLQWADQVNDSIGFDR